MSRFNTTLTGTYPNQVLKLEDSAPLVGTSPRTILDSTGLGVLYGPRGTSPFAPAQIAVSNVERAWSTPAGVQTEMGFDLTFTLTAAGGGGTTEVGQMVLRGLRAGSSPLRLETGILNTFLGLVSGVSVEKRYPIGVLAYSPVMLLKIDDYNVCAAYCYPVLQYDHSVQQRVTLDSPLPPHTNMTFQNETMDGSAAATMAEGTTRVYTIAFRINDRTNTAVSSNPGAPQEWIWTLRGYQQYFRGLYGKPNYNTMGGRDGRPVYGVVIATTGSRSGANPRGFNPPEFDPRTSPGYKRTADLFIQRCRDFNVKRTMITAVSGVHDDTVSGNHTDPPQTGNFAFRFASGLAEVPGVGAATRAELGRIDGAGLQSGYWWGLSAFPERSAVWDAAPHGNDQADPDDETTLKRAKTQGDIATGPVMYGRCIGLDAFEFPLPSKTVRWLQWLRKTYPRTMFITEKFLPDYLHVLAPTYIIEVDAGNFIQIPHHLSNFICPGNELWLQSSGVPPLMTLNQRVLQAAVLGYTLLSNEFFGTPDQLPGHTRAVGRWLELGEAEILHHRFPHSRGVRWRSRVDRPSLQLR